MFSPAPGSLVRCREREWVILPSQDPDLLLLRPLTGSEQDATGIYLPLGLETVEPATFPLPDPDAAGDFESARLLWDAARLSFRSGAGPFRCLGRLSVRARPYQMVPLLMALRLDPVRLLIADDVGVGKTIEACLIAREMLDRGEVGRLAVLCPPYLCDQWQRELAEKFHVEAVVVRAGTAAQLERRLPRRDLSIFEYYPHMVVSIDYAKAQRRRDAFILHCPDLLIVDEAHGAARPSGQSRGQQQRHQLLLALANKPRRHLLLLTATPHSGVEDSFRSLLGLITPKFAEWDLSHLSEKRRKELAHHFIQRRRADVIRWMGEETPFPERDSKEAPYRLHPEYRQLFDDVYDFAREMVRSGETLSGFRRRVRYWTALALLRCVMSSPAAAVAALEGRAARLEEAEGLEADDSLFSPYVYDPVEREGTVDISPSSVIEEGERNLADRERRRLRAFARRAAGLSGDEDAKVVAMAGEVGELLAAGFHPIVYCRYIATADYVADELRGRLANRWPNVHAISVTGALSEDERQIRVADLAQSPHRILVATDCLSEGINLQQAFNAVVHYDLPWNPNRLEQREGRVDRYGQTAPQVKTVLVYGQDNPIDGAVLDVLIRKAVDIRRTLGITVPLPMESESVVEAVLRSLLLREDREPRQLSLFDAADFDLAEVHQRWDEAVNRERISRTRFAQHAIKPDEVARELQETDAALGDPLAVERFIRTACQRLNAPLQHRNDHWLLDTRQLLPALRHHLAPVSPDSWPITFHTPTPEGVTYIGRNHNLTNVLVENLLDTAIAATETAQPAARSAAIRTDAVAQRTVLLLLRVRFLLTGDQATSNLAEECIVCAFTGQPGQIKWVDETASLALLQDARPTTNVAPAERHRWLTEVLAWLPEMEDDLAHIVQARGERLHQAHRRVRLVVHTGQLKVVPQGVPDILGLYVLVPVPKGVAE